MVGKIPDQHLHVWLFSNPGDKVQKRWSTTGQIRPVLSTRIWTLSPGLENNNTVKCWSGIFPTILTYIQGTKFYSCWNLLKPWSQSGTYADIVLCIVYIWIETFLTLVPSLPASWLLFAPDIFSVQCEVCSGMWSLQCAVLCAVCCVQCCAKCTVLCEVCSVQCCVKCAVYSAVWSVFFCTVWRRACILMCCKAQDNSAKGR